MENFHRNNIDEQIYRERFNTQNITLGRKTCAYRDEYNIIRLDGKRERLDANLCVCSLLISWYLNSLSEIIQFTKYLIKI